MTTKAEKFRAVAERVIINFATSIGKSTYKRYVSEDYDTDTGVRVPNYLTLSFYIAFDTLDDELDNRKSSDDPRLPIDSRKAFIAGSLAGESPAIGDLIIAADTGLTYTVVEIEQDMYNALFECLLFKVPNDTL